MPTDELFTGQQQESPDVYDYGARMYNTDLGRMPQPDPLVPDPFNPQSYNAYSYVINNPTNYVDPTGMFGVSFNSGDWQLDTGAAEHILKHPGARYGPPPTPSQCGPKCVPVRGKLYPVRRGLDLEGYSWGLHAGVVLGGYGAPGVLPRCYISSAKAWVQCPDPKGFLSRFLTLECLGFALNVAGTAALAFGGPLAVPIAAGLYATSAYVSGMSGDLPGLGTSSFAHAAVPLQFAEYSRGLALFGLGAGYVATGVSAGSCFVSALK